MVKYGLIGFPLGHSFSPGYFKEKFEQLQLEEHRYDAYPIQSILEIETLLENQVQGFNVTIPYKQEILDYLDETECDAALIGAVNCVQVDYSEGKAKLKGYNTDLYGFEESLKQFLGGEKPGKALVLGTGGAAKAVFYSLDRLGIEYTIVSRKEGFLQYVNLTKGIMLAHPLIINTTPVGMYPHSDVRPELLYEYIGENHFCYDLIYNPEKTLFLKSAEEMGAKIKNGYDMLVLQAEKSWEIWNQNK